MNPPARPRPSAPAAQRGTAAPASPLGHLADALQTDELPSLAQILEHFRRHGTVARTVAVERALPAALPRREAIDGLQTREHEGHTLFDEFFGPPER